MPDLASNLCYDLPGRGGGREGVGSTHMVGGARAEGEGRRPGWGEGRRR